MNEKLELRVYALVDRMEAQYAAITGTVARGDVPLPGMAQLYLEVAPGSSVLNLLDAALKSTGVRPGFQILEREFGQVEIHSEHIDDVREAGRCMLERAGLSEQDRIRPQVVSDYLVTNVDAYQAQLINRERHGALLLPGDSLFVMEVEPAGYVVLAANAAERNADVKLVTFDPVGRYGRLYLAGEQSAVRSGSQAAQWAIQENAAR